MSGPPVPFANQNHSAQLANLEKSLLASANQAYKCASLLDDWQPTRQKMLWADIDQFMMGLKTLQDESKVIDPRYMVPLKVLERIDEGSNPDMFTRAALDDLRNRNDRIRSQMANTEILRESLDVCLTEWDSQGKETKE